MILVVLEAVIWDAVEMYCFIMKANKNKERGGGKKGRFY